MRRYLPLLALAALIVVAVTTDTTPTSQTAAPASRCVPGNSFMGCSLPAPGFATPHVAAPAGRKFIDVSDWQPSVNWPAVKASGVFAVVIKAGEGLRADPTFAAHVAGARAAGLQVQAYWFVRASGCAAEVAAIRAVVPRSLPVVLDIEVPGLRGYATCLKADAHAVYTSPGTWPGGSSDGLSLWQAEYGPVLHPFFTPVAAWQFTSSASVPGISGSSDESVNFGLFTSAPPPPVCFHHRISRSACAAVKRQIASDQRAVTASRRAWGLAVVDLAAHHCVRPYRRGVCIHRGHDVAVFSQRAKYFAAVIARTEAVT